MFHFALTLAQDLHVEFSEPELEIGEFESEVMGICAALADTSSRFDIGGFGTDDWDLDIRYDMSTFIEQLPDVYGAIAKYGSAELDLYSPGVERTLFFGVNSEKVAVRCASRTDWRPCPEIEEISRDELLASFRALSRQFGIAASKLFPEVNFSRPLADWQE
ncbi:hypothetical protein [Amycolatopsis lexingtonensis]|uniref:hypothetical protein n=1 Tax=Amycolatopsis lexingtonensis TaxID=218822 RepID=UPI003F72E94C